MAEQLRACPRIINFTKFSINKIGRNMSSNEPLFSIVTPTYNRPQLLKRAIQSVLRQDCGDFELIIVDDGSRPDSNSIVSQFTDSRIKLLRNINNIGVSESRNEGVRRAKGKFITFLDDDDEFEPQFLHATKKLLLQQPSVDMCWSGVVIRRYCKHMGEVTEIEKRIFEIKSDDPSNHKQLLCIGTGFGVTIRHDVLEKVGGFDPTLMVSEDTDLFMRLIFSGAKLAVVPGLNVVLHEHTAPKLTSDEMNARTIEETVTLMSRYARELIEFPWVLKHLRAHIDWLKGVVSTT